nr:capsule biosynthesis GfcC family protein [Dyella sedimenti]
MQIQASGDVATPGAIELSEKARLSDAALAAHVQADAYMVGAAWLRPSLQVEQQRQKAGLLFDLDSVRRQALKDGQDELATLSQSLGAWLQAMPVTGRQVALLDPRAVEVTPMENRPVAEGDTLYYPTRPATIQVVGAVAQRCELPFVALRDARDYLKACPTLVVADADSIFVIQPDGRVFRQNVALWNRSAPMPLAPGAVIYVPIGEHRLHGVAPGLNNELAAFLATQPIAIPESAR